MYILPSAVSSVSAAAGLLGPVGISERDIAEFGFHQLLYRFGTVVIHVSY